MDQVRMRIDKPRQRHAPAQIELLRPRRFRQRLDLRPRSHGHDQAIAHQQPAIFDYSQIGKGTAPPRPVSAQRQKLRRARDEKGIRQSHSIMPKSSRVAQASSCAVSIAGYFEFGFSKTSNKANAAKQVIVFHHGLNGIGNKTTITRVHHGQAAFSVVTGSNFNSPLIAYKYGRAGPAFRGGPLAKHGGQRLPKHLSRFRHFPYSIGTFTPAFFANAIASGYPASTCRATPVPGSLVSTRSMRFAISLVPSATVTCPECCEYPIPTPPPL